MLYKDFKYVTPIQLRFKDIDRLDHVNNACYLTFFELGRVNYFNEVLNRNINWNERGFVTARTEIDHIAPLYLLDEVYCFTKVAAIGTKSITIHDCVAKKVNDQFIECANGVGILVAMNYLKKDSIELTVKWRELFETFEK